MKPILSICIFLSSLLMLANCGFSSAKQSTQSAKSVTSKNEDSGLDLSKYKKLPIKANKTYTLKSNWDLKGETYLLPEGVTLKGRGGLFKNGTLIGNNTKIDTKKPLFDKVSLIGYWNVPEVSTRMFSSLDYENSLRDVLALTHPEVMNKVVIEDGDYSVSAKSFQPALEVCSNTTLVINGTIKLVPNNFKGCFVVQIKDADNVVIEGTGRIEGDKKEHKGIDGEWGHGINVLGTHNITIQDIHVDNCWGDCIYVGDLSTNVTIKDCFIEGGRRQGISLTSADNVLISHCTILNVSGKKPQYAIDIEPNEKESVDNIIIKEVVVKDCYGGIKSWRPDDAAIGNITIQGCHVSGTKCDYPIYIQRTNAIIISECDVDADSQYGILVKTSGNATITNNVISSKGKEPILTYLNKNQRLNNNRKKQVYKK